VAFNSDRPDLADDGVRFHRVCAWARDGGAIEAISRATDGTLANQSPTASAELPISELSSSGAILPSVGALLLAALCGLIGFRLARAVGRGFRPAN
jgi:hypothetical protein